MTGTITILGTQHNEQESFQLVRKSISNRNPDTVAVELPPGYFEPENPDWSLKSALNPLRDETLSGLFFAQLKLDGDYWQVDEMPLAARVASDHDIPVALIDQPFVESMDRIGQGLWKDMSRSLRTLHREWNVHQSHLSDAEWAELADRDAWRLGMAVSPVVHYFRALQEHGATNLADKAELAKAEERFDEKAVGKKMEMMRLLLPHTFSSNIDDRDEHMAGRLRWLANDGDDVLAFVASGHVEGIRECLEDERPIDSQHVSKPTFAVPPRIPTNPLQSE
jgi:pheromone shutdown protein TraB